MNLNEEANRARLFLGLTQEDLDTLDSVKGFLLSRVDSIVDGVLETLLSDQEAMEIAKKAGLSPEQARSLLKSVVYLTLEGNFDGEHARKVFMIGAAHLRAGVGPRLMILNAGAFAREVSRVLLEGGRAEAVVPSLKAISWTLYIIMASYLEAEARSLKEASGLKPRLVEKLKRIKADEIYRQFKSLETDIDSGQLPPTPERT